MNVQAQKLRVLAVQASLAGFARRMGQANPSAIQGRHAERLPELRSPLLDGNGRSSTGYAYALRVLVAIAVTYGLIVGALLVSPGDAFQARAGRASHGAPAGLHHSATIAIAALRNG